MIETHLTRSCESLNVEIKWVWGAPGDVFLNTVARLDITLNDDSSVILLNEYHMINAERWNFDISALTDYFLLHELFHWMQHRLDLLGNPPLPEAESEAHWFLVFVELITKYQPKPKSGSAMLLFLSKPNATPRRLEYKRTFRALMLALRAKGWTWEDFGKR